MSRDSLASVISELCSSQGKSLTGVAMKCGWSSAELQRLLNPQLGPTEEMVRDLAWELMIDAATLRALLFL